MSSSGLHGRELQSKLEMNRAGPVKLARRRQPLLVAPVHPQLPPLHKFLHRRDGAEIQLPMRADHSASAGSDPGCSETGHQRAGRWPTERVGAGGSLLGNAPKLVPAAHQMWCVSGAGFGHGRRPMPGTSGCAGVNQPWAAGLSGCRPQPGDRPSHAPAACRLILTLERCRAARHRAHPRQTSLMVIPSSHPWRDGPCMP